MGNREANYSVVNLSSYNDLPVKRSDGRGDNLAHLPGSIPLPGLQLI